jgi:cellulose synthase/poly-beta-1,6-N-acetylglucosamine synthase-like glycosyltransferase
MEFGCMMGWAHATARNGKAENGSGANLLWRRRVWLELDLCSDEASGDDVFALASLVARGGQTASAWCPEAIATTVPASSWRDWVQQRARWGRKARKYRSGGAQHVSALVLTYLLLLPALAGSAPASAVALFATKFLLDAQYTNRIARAYSLPWNPVSDAVRLAFAYPVLVAAAGLRMAAPLAWKGRRI